MIYNQFPLLLHEAGFYVSITFGTQRTIFGTYSKVRYTRKVELCINASSEN